MQPTSGPSVRAPSAPARGWRGVFASPSTRLGRWTVALGTAFAFMFIFNLLVFVPGLWDAPVRPVGLHLYGVTMLAVGLTAGITGLIALLQRGERSWLVMLSVLPGLFVTAFVLAEFFGSH